MTVSKSVPATGYIFCSRSCHALNLIALILLSLCPDIRKIANAAVLKVAGDQVPAGIEAMIVLLHRLLFCPAAVALPHVGIEFFLCAGWFLARGQLSISLNEGVTQEEQARPAVSCWFQSRRNGLNAIAHTLLCC